MNKIDTLTNPDYETSIESTRISVLVNALEAINEVKVRDNA